MQEVLPVVEEYGNKIFGNDWTFQQDGAKPHTHRLSQEWCQDNLPAFFDKDRWPPNSPDFNSLDYSIWDELGQSIQWDRVTSEKALIIELKEAVHRIRQEVVRESCATWTARLDHVSKNGGEYFSK